MEALRPAPRLPPLAVLAGVRTPFAKAFGASGMSRPINLAASPSKRPYIAPASSLARWMNSSSAMSLASPMLRTSAASLRFAPAFLRIGSPTR